MHEVAKELAQLGKLNAFERLEKSHIPNIRSTLAMCMFDLAAKRSNVGFIHEREFMLSEYSTPYWISYANRLYDAEGKARLQMENAFNAEMRRMFTNDEIKCLYQWHKGNPEGMELEPANAVKNAYKLLRLDTFNVLQDKALMKKCADLASFRP
jgi:hypothetical protein